MTPKDIIKMMAALPNQDAELNFKVNLINEDEDAFDIEDCYLDILQAELHNEVYDVIISRDRENPDENISALFEDNDELNIKLKKDNAHNANIIVTNGENGVLREIAVTPKHGVTKMDAILRVLQNIL